MKKLLILVLLVASLTAAVGAVTDADRRKAEYVYLGASDDLASGSIDDYILKLRRASRLNPADIDIAADAALLMLSSSNVEIADVERALSSIRNRFLANPSDYLSGEIYVKVAQALGRIDEVEMVWTKLDSAYPQRNDPAINLSMVLLHKAERGDTAAFGRAMAIYDRLENAMGIDPNISGFKIKAWASRRDTASIISELGRLYRSAPGNYDINLTIGQYYNAIEMPDSALAYYDRAAAIDSLEGGSYVLRAHLYKEIGDSVAYDREVFRALRSPMLDFEPKYDLLKDYVMTLYNDSTQHDRIVQMFDVMQTVNPGEALVHQLYGAYLAECDDFQQAAEQFGYATELDPTDITNWQYLIQVCNSQGEYLKAATKASEAIPYFTDNLVFPVIAASSFRQIGDYHAGLAVLNDFDVSGFTNTEALSEYYLQKADIYFALKQIDSAFVNYERALQYNPSNYMAMNNMAYSMTQVPGMDLNQAERYAQMAVRAEPDKSSTIDTYAWVLFKLKKYNEARTYIDRLLEVYAVSGSPSTWKEQIGKKLEENGNTEVNQGEIDDIFNKIIDSITSEELEHAGDIYFMSGEPEPALEFWELALEKDPDNELLAKKVKNKTFFFE